MKKGVFLETENVQQLRRAVARAEDADRGMPGMVAVWGEAGFGKTMAARSIYVERGGHYLRVMEGYTQAAFLQDLCYEVKGARPHGAHRCKKELIASLEASPATLFVDEADRLRTPLLEDLRDIHDMSGACVVLIGETGLPTLLESRARINDRIPSEYRVPFAALSRTDVALYAQQAADLTLSPEACALIHTGTGGNFRRTHNALLSIEQAARARETVDVDADLARAALGTVQRGRR